MYATWYYAVYLSNGQARGAIVFDSVCRLVTYQCFLKNWALVYFRSVLGRKKTYNVARDDGSGPTIWT